MSVFKLLVVDFTMLSIFSFQNNKKDDNRLSDNTDINTNSNNTSNSNRASPTNQVDITTGKTQEPVTQTHACTDAFTRKHKNPVCLEAYV